MQSPANYSPPVFAGIREENREFDVLRQNASHLKPCGRLLCSPWMARFNQTKQGVNREADTGRRTNSSRCGALPPIIARQVADSTDRLNIGVERI